MYLYRGEQFDPDLGLYYLRARYYNPLTGRFMSRDPEDGEAPIPVRCISTSTLGEIQSIGKIRAGEACSRSLTKAGRNLPQCRS